MHRTNIYLEHRQMESLDRLAEDAGVSRAELIRRIIDRALGADDDLTADLAAIEASFGVLDTFQPMDRTPGAREEHLHQVWDHAR